MTLDLAKLETLVVGDFNYQEFDMKIKKLHLQFLDAYKVFTEKAADKCVDMIHKVCISRVKLDCPSLFWTYRIFSACNFVCKVEGKSIYSIVFSDFVCLPT